MTAHVVVIGAGMVGLRFVEELLAADHEQRFTIDVVGDEPRAPYNRILLTEVLAGRTDVASTALPVPDDPRVRLLTGTRAMRVDRGSRTVVTTTGPIGYDHVVWATGASAAVPPVVGLDHGVLPAGAHVLRTLDDAAALDAACVAGVRVTVVGAGPLGLEAACALVRRGAEVTVVHHGDAVMDRHLSPGASHVLETAATDLGLAVVTGSGPRVVTTTDGAVSAVHLADGRALPTDLLLLSCGIEPRTALAASAGLATARGVVVDAEQRSATDPAHWAVGDCAEGPDGCTGLVAPGWDQARRAARALVGAAADDVRSPAGDVLRLKAAGLDLVTMGVTGRAAELAGHRVVTMHDPVGRRHVELAVADGLLVGATCVGSPDVGADLLSRYGRPTPTPADPLMLVYGGGAGAQAPASPTTMPSSTTVCRCNGVSKARLVQAWDDGATDVAGLVVATRASTGCGSCKDTVCGIADWLRASDGDSSQVAARDGEQTVPAAKHRPVPAETTRS